MTIDAKRDLANISAASSPAGKDLRLRTSASRTSKPPRCYGMNFKERRPAPPMTAANTGLASRRPPPRNSASAEIERLLVGADDSELSEKWTAWAFIHR